MHYRRFGRTDIQMPVFSTGGMRYQDGWKDKPLGEIDPKTTENIEATIRASLQHGIHHIETARGYGPSERQLGQVLPKFPRQDLIVQTKIGPTDTGDEFLAHFAESLDRLQLDHVDLLGIHGINNFELVDKVRKKGGCLEAARRLQREGKVKHVGFSTHAPLPALLAAIDIDEHGFDYVNLHYYYIFQRNRAAIDAATKRDMGVFIISPTDKGGKLYDPPDKLVELCDPLHPIEFNDLWTLNQPGVHTLSLGASKPGDYDLHISADAILEKADELLPPIVKRLEDAMEAATGFRSPEAISWDGVPEHYEAPGNLNLPIMLWLNQLARGWDMTDYGKMRFNLLGGADHWFPGAKADTVKDVDDKELQAAITHSPHAAQIPDLLTSAVEMLGGEAVKRQSESG
ncbi:MAG: aldo/keto reductase [Planctomycetota bacterium]